MSVCWNFLVDHASPPMPGMPSTVSAATIVVKAKPSARRMPVNSSGRTDGSDDVADDLRQRIAPSEWAASIRSRRIPSTPLTTESAIGGEGGEEQQPDLGGVLDAEPDDQEPEVRQRAAGPDEVDVGLGTDPEGPDGGQQRGRAGRRTGSPSRRPGAQALAAGPRGAPTGSSPTARRMPSWVVDRLEEAVPHRRRAWGRRARTRCRRSVTNHHTASRATIAGTRAAEPRSRSRRHGEAVVTKDGARGVLDW